MATDFSAMQPAPQERTQSTPSWLHVRALWAGLSVITMWLAVLFVGIFGSDFVASSSNGFTKIPVVVFLLPFVLPATIVVGRRGFASSPDEQHGPPHKETHAADGATAVPSTLRAKPVG
jgi:hypothetical protein